MAVLLDIVLTIFKKERIITGNLYKPQAELDLEPCGISFIQDDLVDLIRFIAFWRYCHG